MADASDNFNRADENPLTTSKWLNIGSDGGIGTDKMKVVSNTAFATNSGSYAFSYWIQDSFASDGNHYSQVDATIFASGSQFFVTARTQGDGTSVTFKAYMGFILRAERFDVYKYISGGGGFTQLQQNNRSDTDAVHTYKIDVSGGVSPVIKLYFNGSQINTSYTGDSSIASGGAPGIGSLGGQNTGVPAVDYYMDNWLGGPISGGAAVLVAALGTFVLTGVASTFLITRLLAAVKGTFTLTGQAARLLKGFLLTAVKATFTLTGIAANFVLTRLLTAAQATYTLTGQAARLLKGFLLTAAQTTYTFTGIAANLVYSSGAKILTAAVAAFTLTGQSVNLRATRLLSLVKGTFSLTGNATGLYFGRLLTAVKGTFTLTGVAATFLRTIRLVASVVTYLLTGRDATFTYSADEVDPWTEVIRSTNAIYNQITRSSDSTYNQVSRSSDDDWNEVPRE